MSKSNKLVYSTESGTIEETETQHKPSGPAGKIIKIRREVKGRRGKTVTTLHGFNLPENQLQQVAGELKRYCGSGGSVKDGIIIIQGDQRQKVEIYLTEEGYTVKRDGG
ncbi:MAG: stress response translation initiation inhibitor YciH [Calditrichia bacterium]|nr:stress response translation initiation inhibitor YciH [Calditrichia bacterium]